MTRPVRTFALALAATSAAAAPAAGQGIESRHLWATINICDTLRHPDTIGIRASMPGSSFGKREEMFMRFKVQYFSRRDQLWHNISKGGSSEFRSVGPANVKARQAGVSFRFTPATGTVFLLRGKVNFQWRRNGKVMRSASRLTTAGHRSTAGSDPEGYSSDTCVIT